MFDGVPEQFHQFITPRTSLPIHLPFPLHASNSSPNTFPPPFDPYNTTTTTSHHQLLPLQLQPNNNLLLHPSLHHQSSTHKDHEEHKEENSTTTAAVVSMNFQIEERDQRQLQSDQQQLIDPWTNDEVLSLLRIRSNMESWFPELTWEHVSRKMAEVGYKRSAEKCKEKFEEESRYFNSINNYTKNFRFLSEFEDIYQGDHQNNSTTPHQEVEKLPSDQGQDKILMDQNIEDSSRNIVVTEQKEEQNDVVEANEKRTKEDRKRKRIDDRFEMLKGYCESFVHKMMEQQEEMHKKLLEDMMRRDEEKLAREEAWKKQEVDRMNKELEIMAQEQAIAGDRQANMIQFLNKFAQIENIGKEKVKVTNPNPSSEENSNLLLDSSNSPPQSNIPPLPSFTKENPNPSSPSQDTLVQVSSSTLGPINPISTSSLSNKSTKDHDVGRRWPKDEVLALINLRCTTHNNNNNEDNKEGNNKAPLWERISQGMLEMGYKRSAKRCKEKWENINKYFRKTKDVNKKRSLDSRTCPYFHQLSSLYNQGKLVLQSERQENQLSPPDENSGEAVPDQNQGESSQVGSSGFSMQVDHDGEKTLMQVPSLDFDQF